MSKQHKAARAEHVDDADEADDDAPTTANVRAVRKNPRQLPGPEIQPLGSKFAAWGVIAHADHSIEDVLHPMYLWNKAEQIEAHATIEIKHALGFYVVVLDVVRVDRATRSIISNVRHIFDYTADGTRRVAPDVSGARVDFLGSERQWAVIDGHHVIKDRLATRAEAEIFIVNLKKAV